MKPDRPLIGSVLFLAAGLGIIFGYCHGNSSITAAYPFSGTVLHVDFTTVGPGVLGGLVLAAIGLFLMVWSFIAAIVRQISLMLAAESAPDKLLD